VSSTGSPAKALVEVPTLDDILKIGEGLRRDETDLREWSRRVRVEEGESLDFPTFPFQRELYDAFGDKDLQTVDVMKSAQCGISAAGVSLALYAGDVWAANVLYVLPSSDDAYDFSDTRVKPAIEDSLWLSFRVASTDNKGLKRIGKANLYFRGSVSERKALSIPADVLVLDELDRLDQRNVPKLRRRLASPTSMKLERRFSNPSFPEFGIHELFLASDQREWFVRCPRCRHEASMAYEQTDEEHYVDEARLLRVCGACSRELTPERIAAGRWVAARTTKGLARGYHVSRLDVPGEDVLAIATAHRSLSETELQAHYNFDLGLPYSPKGGSLSRELVYACRRDYAMPASYQGTDWVTAGVDVGKVLHVRISRWLPERAVPLFIGEIDTFAELGLLWSRYGVNFGVIDERPEEREARRFLKAHRGQVLLCRWSGEEQRDPMVIDDERGLLIARRTGSCDKLVAAFTEQHRLLPRDLPEGYVKQVTAPHRSVETRPNGQKVARYVSENADHFFFAECYDLLAREARGAPALAGGIEPETMREQIRRRRRTGQ
jgi:hypothetical protein